MKFILQFFIFFLGSVAVSAQIPFIQNYSSKLYKGAFQTWQVAQDSNQVMYIANNDVILRYDGVSWESISNNTGEFTSSLYTAPNGVIYFGGDKNLGYLAQKEDGTIKMVSLRHKFSKEDIEEDLDIYAIKATSKSVVFANRSHLYVYDLSTQKIKKIKINMYSLNSISYINVFIFQDKICAYTPKGLFYLESNELKPWANLSKIESNLSSSFLTSFPDNDSLLLSISKENEMYLCKFKGSQASSIKKIGGKVNALLKDKRIFIVQPLKNGLFAINRFEEGIIIANIKGEIIYNLKKENGLSSNTYNHIFQDKMNNIWLTGHEISQLMLSSPIDYYYQPSSQGSPFLALGKHQSYQYLGSSTKIDILTSEKVFKTILDNNDETWNFFTFDEELFAATSNGIYKLNGEQSQLILKKDFVLSLEKISASTFLFGVFDTGLWKLIKENGNWEALKVKGFDDEIRYIKKDESGDVWVSNYSKGIFKLKLNQSLDSVIKSKTYGKTEGLPSSTNNRIYRLKNGEIVFTTIDGIYQYNSQKDRFEPHPAFKKALTNKCVYNLVEHPSGDIYVWIGELSPNRQVGGVLKKQKTGEYTLDTRPFHRIELPANNFIVDVDVPMLVLDNGNVWFGIGDRLFEYTPSKAININDKFSLSITSVMAGDIKTKSILLSKNSLVLFKESIPFELNKISFTFAAHHYKEETKMRYQYLLKGQDKEWSEWSYQPNAQFNNLTEGNYTLCVRAKNIYDVESEIVSFSFVIKAPIYRTGWAYLIYLMLFALFVIFIVKFYTNNLLQQKNLLEQKVEERTQEIQQKNEEILVQRDDILQINAILEQQKEEVTTQAEKLQEANQVKNQLFSIISHDLRSPLNQLVATLQIFQAGDFSEKELQKILPELSDSVQNTLSLTDNLLFWARDQMEGIQMMPQSFRVLPIIEENIQLFRPVATRKGIELKSNIEENFNVYADKEMIKLVFRNLINNAIKFCNSEDLITLEAKITPQNQLEIAIIDTGVGIEAEKIPPLFSSQSTSTRGTSNEKGIGLGLILCKDFLEKNEGSIRVESVYTKGSIFYITLPLAS